MDNPKLAYNGIDGGNWLEYMGISESRGYPIWGPYNKDPTIFGTMLGSPILTPTSRDN